MNKNKTLILVILLLSLISCTTMLQIKTPRLPKADMTDIESVALDFKSLDRGLSYEITSLSTDSVISAILRDLNKQYQKNRQRYSTLGNQLINRLEMKLSHDITKKDVYNLVSAYQGLQSQHNYDLLIKVSLNSLQFTDDFTENSSYHGITRITEGLWTRKCYYDISYQLIRRSDARVLGFNNIVDRLSSSEKGVGGHERLASMSSLVDRVVTELEKKISQEFLPSTDYWMISLFKDSENANIVEGNKKANSKDFVAAEKIFLAEFKNSYNISGGINAALLEFYSGDREKALETISDVIRIKGDRDAVEIRERFIRIIENENKMKSLGKKK